MSGYFYSPKLKRSVGYESLWGECLFYYCLELDNSVIRYYEQPVIVPISILDNHTMQYSIWNHIPDVLVYRYGCKPHLYQVKGSQKDGQHYIQYKACVDFCERNGWDYSVIHPKDLPAVLISNIMFLWNYSKVQKNFSSFVDEIIYKARVLSNTNIINLAKSFSGKIDYRFILPVVYHLIFKGELQVDYMQPITSKSEIKYGTKMPVLSDYFERERMT